MAENTPFIRSFYEVTKPLFVYGQNKFLEELNPKGGETICEIGCGNGNNLIKLFKRNQNLKLIGFDYSASIIKSTTERIKSRGLEKNIKLVSGFANEYQFEEQIDRFIFSCACIQFCENSLISSRLSVKPSKWLRFGNCPIFK